MPKLSAETLEKLKEEKSERTKPKRRFTISYHFPPLTPIDKEDGSTEWRRQAVKIGRVRSDGSIENCPYRFNPDRICGGVVYTSHTELVKEKRGKQTILRNPANNEIFRRTRSGKGWFSKKSRTFLPNSYLELNPEERGL